jgi:hypothetical protein
MQAARFLIEVASEHWTRFGTCPVSDLANLTIELTLKESILLKRSCVNGSQREL